MNEDMTELHGKAGSQAMRAIRVDEDPEGTFSVHLRDGKGYGGFTSAEDALHWATYEAPLIDAGVADALAWVMSKR